MKTTELYSEEALFYLRKKHKVWRAVLIVLAAVSLAVCVTLVCLTTVKNERSMRIAVSAVSGVAGVVAIYILTFPVLGSRRLASHSERMLADERESHVGAATVSGKGFHIRNSITAMRVTIKDGDTEEHVNVNSEVARLIPTDGARRRYYTVHGYVVAYEEVTDDEDEEIL